MKNFDFLKPIHVILISVLAYLDKIVREGEGKATNLDNLQSTILVEKATKGAEREFEHLIAQ